jgi:hypothetical protein
LSDKPAAHPASPVFAVRRRIFFCVGDESKKRLSPTTCAHRATLTVP